MLPLPYQHKFKGIGEQCDKLDIRERNQNSRASACFSEKIIFCSRDYCHSFQSERQYEVFGLHYSKRSLYFPASLKVY